MVEIWAIAFQVSGALILLLWCIEGARKEKIIERYFPGSNIAHRDNDGNCTLKKEKIQKIGKEAYLNIFAFVDIIIGYSLAFFIVNKCEKVNAFLSTIVITLVILSVENVLASIISNAVYRKDEIVSYDVLKENGVDTVVIAREIDDFFN